MSKTCTRCKQTKPLDCYYKAAGYKDGHHTWCKSCISENTAERRRRDPEGERAKHRNYLLQRRYGLTSEEVDAMGVAQEGLCAICRTRPWEVVDHSHETGDVRGLLCQACNRSLGTIEPNFARAGDYLAGRL